MNKNEKLDGREATTPQRVECEPKHTPGPWKIDTDRMIWVPTDKRVVAGVIAALSSWMGTDEADANARLIAAAPELLRELKHLVRLLEPCEQDGSLQVPGLATLNGARAALSKAETGAARSASAKDLATEGRQ